jgi:hypothetical protein
MSVPFWMQEQPHDVHRFAYACCCCCCSCSLSALLPGSYEAILRVVSLSGWGVHVDPTYLGYPGQVHRIKLTKSQAEGYHPMLSVSDIHKKVPPNGIEPRALNRVNERTIVH